MLRHLLVTVPLLAAVAVGQTDRRIVLDVPGLRAEAYGLELVANYQLTSRLDITASGTGAFLYCILPDPTPACHQTLLIGAGETRLPLAPLGIGGWLLVDPVFASLTVPLRDPIWIPRGPQLLGLHVHLQSVVVRPLDGGGYDFSFSHAMKLSFFST